jgi:hypothetical protein
MFHHAPGHERVKPERFFVNYSQIAWMLIYLSQRWHVAPQLAAWSHNL